jgi:hypothetical protein
LDPDVQSQNDCVGEARRGWAQLESVEEHQEILQNNLTASSFRIQHFNADALQKVLVVIV